jgi:hypothetical protein
MSVAADDLLARGLLLHLLAVGPAVHVGVGMGLGAVPWQARLGMALLVAVARLERHGTPGSTPLAACAAGLLAAAMVAVLLSTGRWAAQLAGYGSEAQPTAAWQLAIAAGAAASGWLPALVESLTIPVNVAYPGPAQHLEAAAHLALVIAAPSILVRLLGAIVGAISDRWFARTAPGALLQAVAAIVAAWLLLASALDEGGSVALRPTPLPAESSP